MLPPDLKAKVDDDKLRTYVNYWRNKGNTEAPPTEKKLQAKRSWEIEHGLAPEAQQWKTATVYLSEEEFEALSGDREQNID